MKTDGIKAGTMVLAAAFACSVGTASAQQLTWASGFPPGGSLARAIDDSAAYVAEVSDMSAKHYAMSLLNYSEILQGVRDGIVDIGYVVSPYFPSELSETNLVADLSLEVTTNTQSKAPSLLMVGALTEYLLLHCDDCQTQYRSQNQVYIAGASPPAYALLCTRPVRSLKDIKGLKVRAGSGSFANWAEHVGAVSVSIPVNEMYTALGQGALDCGTSAIPELVNLQLGDIVTHVTTDVPGGLFAGVGSTNVNLDKWRAMTPEQREAMFRVGAHLASNATVSYIQAGHDAREISEKKGIEFLTADESLQKATREFVASDRQALIDTYSQKYNVPNVDHKVQTFLDIVTRWDGLIGEAAMDADAFGKLLWDEIYAKLDPQTYGLE